MKNLVLVLMVLCLLAQGAAAAIFTEDFQTDPLASRWTIDSTAGFPIYWTGTNPSSIGASLPAEIGNPLDALYVFSEGQKNAWSTDVTENTQASYTASLDFNIAGNADVVNIVLGMKVQRDGATAYETPLMINLDYNYIQSTKKPVKIIKTPS